MTQTTFDQLFDLTLNKDKEVSRLGMISFLQELRQYPFTKIFSSKIYDYQSMITLAEEQIAKGNYADFVQLLVITSNTFGLRGVLNMYESYTSALGIKYFILYNQTINLSGTEDIFIL